MITIILKKEKNFINFKLKLFQMKIKYTRKNLKLNTNDKLICFKCQRKLLTNESNINSSQDSYKKNCPIHYHHSKPNHIHKLNYDPLYNSSSKPNTSVTSKKSY